MYGLHINSSMKLDHWVTQCQQCCTRQDSNRNPSIRLHRYNNHRYTRSSQPIKKRRDMTYIVVVLLPNIPDWSTVKPNPSVH